MKTIIAGGRDFVSDIRHWDFLDWAHRNYHISEVVSGGAKGADSYGEFWAGQYRIPWKRFPADWKAHGKAAGFKRNEQMAEYADACILFPGGRGTADMKRRAEKHGLKIIEWKP